MQSFLGTTFMAKSFLSCNHNCDGGKSQINFVVRARRKIGSEKTKYVQNTTPWAWSGLNFIILNDRAPNEEHFTEGPFPNRFQKLVIVDCDCPRSCDRLEPTWRHICAMKQKFGKSDVVWNVMTWFVEHINGWPQPLLKTNPSEQAICQGDLANTHNWHLLLMHTCIQCTLFREAKAETSRPENETVHGYHYQVEHTMQTKLSVDTMS